MEEKERKIQAEKNIITLLDTRDILLIKLQSKLG